MTLSSRRFLLKNRSLSSGICHLSATVGNNVFRSSLSATPVESTKVQFNPLVFRNTNQKKRLQLKTQIRNCRALIHTHVVNELAQRVPGAAQPLFFLYSMYVHFPRQPRTIAPSLPPGRVPTERLPFSGFSYNFVPPPMPSTPSKGP